MSDSHAVTRRKFLKLTSMAALGASPLVGLTKPLLFPASSPGAKLTVYLFSKHLQFLDYQDMSEAAKEMGFDGIDLTVRPKGHVLPERVADDFPRATEAMRSFGLRTEMFTSKVLDARNETDQIVLQAASHLGYEYYRTGWFKYKQGADILESVDSYRSKLRGIAKLNEKFGLSGSYQNHSGHYFGASIWDLDQALDGLSPKYMGCQYDIMHATVEGGKNWEIDFNLIRNHVNTLVVKDFLWSKVEGTWKPLHIPMGEGMVDFKRYFSLLKEHNINVPLSLHCEHDLGGAEKGRKPTITTKEVFRRIKKDLIFLRRSWEAA